MKSKNKKPKPLPILTFEGWDKEAVTETEVAKALKQCGKLAKADKNGQLHIGTEITKAADEMTAKGDPEGVIYRIPIEGDQAHPNNRDIKDELIKRGLFNRDSISSYKDIKGNQHRGLKLIPVAQAYYLLATYGVNDFKFAEPAIHIPIKPIFEDRRPKGILQVKNPEKPIEKACAVHEELISIKEIAERLNCSKSTVYRHLHTIGVKGIPHFKVGKNYKVKRVEFEKWYESVGKYIA